MICETPLDDDGDTKEDEDCATPPPGISQWRTLWRNWWRSIYCHVQYSWLERFLSQLMDNGQTGPRGPRVQWLVSLPQAQATTGPDLERGHAPTPPPHMTASSAWVTHLKQRHAQSPTWTVQVVYKSGLFKNLYARLLSCLSSILLSLNLFGLI